MTAGKIACSSATIAAAIRGSASRVYTALEQLGKWLAALRVHAHMSEVRFDATFSLPCVELATRYRASWVKEAGVGSKPQYALNAAGVQSVGRVQKAVVARKLDAAALRVARAGGARGDHVVVDLVGDGGDGEEHRGGGAAAARRRAARCSAAAARKEELVACDLLGGDRPR